jgi:hypothetical protein
MKHMKSMKKYLSFQLELKNKKTYFSDFPCVALRNARAHFIVSG